MQSGKASLLSFVKTVTERHVIIKIGKCNFYENCYFLIYILDL